MKRVITACILLITAQLLQAQTIRYVKPVAMGLGDGSSWANAADDLQQIINISTDADTIWIAAGTYQAAAGTNFSLIRGTSLIGGFNGTETSAASRNLQADTTILKAAANKPVIIRNTNQPSVFDGLDITGGKSDLNASGLLCVNNSRLYMNNCRVYDNSSIPNAGRSALFFSGGRVYLTNCLIYNNKGLFTFALYAATNYISLTNCTIVNNGTANSAIAGSVIQNSNGANNFHIQNSIIWDNGGGITSQYSPAIITYSCLQGGGTTDGNINANPLLVAGSYTLQPGSPCLNTGDPQTNSLNYAIQAGYGDLAGKHRIAESQIDMGAYESNSTALPVRFGVLSATLNSNRLFVSWTTLIEINNNHFEIEASADGQHFEKIATVASKAIDGNALAELKYEFSIGINEVGFAMGIGIFLFYFFIPSFKKKQWALASSFVAGILFFSCHKSDYSPATSANKLFIRLVQVDKDGTKDYSKIVRVANK